MGYHEVFRSGDDHLGAYVCHFTLSDPDGWTWERGRGPTAYLNVPPLIQTPPPVPKPVLLLPKIAEALVEESVWTRLGAGLLRVLEAGVSFPAMLAALLLLPQAANAPGIPKHPPVVPKDALRLAELERLQRLGQLTKAEQAEHLYKLLRSGTMVRFTLEQPNLLRHLKSPNTRIPKQLESAAAKGRAGILANPSCGLYAGLVNGVHEDEQDDFEQKAFGRHGVDFLGKAGG